MMSAFNEELTAARKAKGMTQEQLAEAMSTSRSAVSHWESGRSIPNIETIKKLTAVLDCTFSMLNIQQDNTSGDAENMPLGSEQTAAETPVPNASAKPPKAKRSIVLAAAAALLVLIVCIVVPKLSGSPNDGGQSASNAPTLNAVVPPKAKSIQWFSSPVQPETGKTFVAIQFNENPLPVTGHENLEWMYTVYMTETNGYALNIQKIEITYFRTDNDCNIFTYNSNVVEEWFGAHDIPAYGQRIFNGGMPYSEHTIGMGICVTGTDANGEQYDFHAYLPFSHEMNEQ